MAPRNPFEREAKKYEGKIAKALIEAFNALRTQMSGKELARVLIEEGPEAVINLYSDMFQKISFSVDSSLNEAIIGGSSLTRSLIPEPAWLNINHFFDIFNPTTASFIQTYKFGLITNISEVTRTAIRNLMVEDIREGRNPIATARGVRNSIGLTPGQERAVRNYRKYLETLDTQALQRALRDKRFDSTIKNAINMGKPLSTSQIEKMTNRYRERYIKYRSEVIAKTESLRAVTIGNEENIRQLIYNNDIDTENVRKYWKTRGDEKVRNFHQKIPGENSEGRSLDEDFSTPLGPLRYPRDPRGTAENTIQCRCWVSYKMKYED